MFKKFKFKSLKYTAVFIIFITTVLYGFTVVSSELPDFIKERSPLKVYFNRRPFDLKFDVGNYIIYLNDKAIENFKENTLKVFRSIGRNNPVQNVDQYNTD